MCSTAISNLSKLIADSLTPLIILDPTKVEKENDVAIDKESGLVVSDNTASVVQYMLDLLNQKNMSDNDREAVKSILEITTTSLQNVLAQLGSKLDKRTKQATTMADLKNAIDALVDLEWYEIKSRIINIFSIIYK